MPALVFDTGRVYILSMNSITKIAAIIAFAAATTVSFSAFAAEKKSDLPGVVGNYSIVQPAAEPENVEADSPYGPGFVKVGNTYVKISGKVRYDVEFSTKNKKAPQVNPR